MIYSLNIIRYTMLILFQVTYTQLVINFAFLSLPVFVFRILKCDVELRTLQEK